MGLPKSLEAQPARKPEPKPEALTLQRQIVRTGSESRCNTCSCCLPQHEHAVWIPRLSDNTFTTACIFLVRPQLGSFSDSANDLAYLRNHNSDLWLFRLSHLQFGLRFDLEQELAR